MKTLTLEKTNENVTQACALVCMLSFSLSCCKVTVLNRGPDPMVPMLRWPGAPPRAHRMTLQVPRAYFLLSLTQAPVQMRNVPRSSSLQMSSEPVGRALRSGPHPHQGTLRVQHPPREGIPSCWKSSCNFYKRAWPI